MTKYCGKCQQTQPISEFAKNANRKDGLQTMCRSCKKTYDKAEHQRNKGYYYKKNKETVVRNQLYVYQKLEQSACELCNDTNPMVLTFDHLRDKVMEVSEMCRNSYGLKTLQSEMDKCRILCYNCHMVHTNQENNSIKWRYFNGDDSVKMSLRASALNLLSQPQHRSSSLPA